MYQVFWDEFLLHDLRLDEYFLQGPNLSEELNKVSEFTFDIYPDHPNFKKLEVLVPKIVVKKNGKVVFKGRIISEKQNMDNSKQVTCESVLAFLLDSIQRPFNFQGSPEELFAKIINTHNEQVEEYKRFKIGKLTGANLDSNDYINRSTTDYINTFETIEEKILKTIGGYIFIRYEDDGNYIDWVDDFTSTIGDESSQIISRQVIEFGENLIDITSENDASETYSVIIPLGSEIDEEESPGSSTETYDNNRTVKKRLTIAEVNNGKDYLVNDLAIAKYGWIVAPVDETTWDDVTIASNLLTKAKEYLDNKAIMLKSTLELNALDLNVVDGSIDDFKMGEYIRVQSTPHNLSKTYLLTKKETPLTEPENMKITLGETKETLTGIQIGNGKDTISKIENVLGDYVLNDDVTQIINEEIQNSSYIQQLPDSIMTQVGEKYTSKSEIEELKAEMETKLTQTSAGWDFEFSKIIEQITNIDGTVNSNYQELIKYIRFVDGTIVIGEVNNPLTLTLDNDRLSFMQNGSEVAYVSNNRLYITDGVFLNSVKIGNFGFIPRKNGSLDFKKIVG